MSLFSNAKSKLSIFSQKNFCRYCCVVLNRLKFAVYYAVWFNKKVKSTKWSYVNYIRKKFNHL